MKISDSIDRIDGTMANSYLSFVSEKTHSVREGMKANTRLINIIQLHK